MKYLIGVLLALCLVVPAMAGPSEEELLIPESYVVTREMAMAIQKTMADLISQRNDAQEEAFYWYQEYKMLQQCIMDNPDTAASNCLATI